MIIFLFFLLLWPDLGFAQSLMATWQDNSANPCPSNPDTNCAENEFILERCTGDLTTCAGGPFVEVGRPPRDSTFWVDSNGLNYSTDYTYRVAAINAQGQSEWSNLAQGQTLAGPQPPDTLVSLSCQQTEDAADPTLVLAMGFNEWGGTITADSSGNNNAGTLYGPTWTAQGKNGNALNFDGIDDRVDLAGFAVSGSALTWMAWVRLTDMAGCLTTDCRIVSRASDSTAQGHDVMISLTSVGGSARLRFRLKTNNNTDTLIASSGTLVVNTWHHVAAVYDGSQMRLYLDGQPVGSQSKTGILTISSGVQSWLGNQPPLANAGWSGQMDEVRAYGRALSQVEIQAMMNNPL